MHPGAGAPTPTVLEEDGRHPGRQRGSFSCVERAPQSDGVQDRTVRLEGKHVEGVEHEPGRLPKREAAVDQLVRTVAVVLFEHAFEDIRIFDVTVPYQRPFEGTGERTSLFRAVSSVRHRKRLLRGKASIASARSSCRALRLVLACRCAVPISRSNISLARSVRVACRSMTKATRVAVRRASPTRINSRACVTLASRAIFAQRLAWIRLRRLSVMPIARTWRRRRATPLRFFCDGPSGTSTIHPKSERPSRSVLSTRSFFRLSRGASSTSRPGSR